MHTQTILLPSKAEVTPPPVHARNMQRVRRRVREEDWERDTVSVQNVTCLPVHAKIIWCQSQAQKHIKRNGIQAAPSPSEWILEQDIEHLFALNVHVFPLRHTK